MVKDKAIGKQMAEMIKEKEYPPINVLGIRIGTGEVGKGDYFGPLGRHPRYSG